MPIKLVRFRIRQYFALNAYIRFYFLMRFLFFPFELWCIENVQSQESAIGDVAADITESLRTNDAIVCDAGNIAEPLIESKDVVDLPKITITLDESKKNPSKENLSEIEASSKVHEIDSNDMLAKHVDNVGEQNETAPNEIDKTETIEKNKPTETVVASVSIEIEIENTKMAASLQSDSGEDTNKTTDSQLITINKLSEIASSANTTDEGISMENNINREESSATLSETALNTSDTVTSSNLVEIVPASNETDNATTVKKSKKSRRNGSKAKKSKAKAQEQQPIAEMATEADVYEVIVSPRQRCYQLMIHKNSQRKIPADNCEIFCSNIPVNVLEEELIPLFDRYGKIWNLRLLMSLQNSRRNAGFAFVRYTSSMAAQDAVENLTNYEILPGKIITVRPSQPNLCLFVGNINRNQTKEQIQTIFNRLAKGLVKTVVKSSYYEADKNCGFCFLEYESHTAAVNARLTLNRTRVWGRQLFVDWSQRRIENNTMGSSEENNTMFINNLPKQITDEIIKSKLSTFGEIDNVVIIKDYAFVQFKCRDSILAALNDFNAKEAFESDEAEISFALKRQQRNRNAFARQSKASMDRPYGVRPRMHRAFKRMGSSVKLSVQTAQSQSAQPSTAAAAIQLGQMQSNATDAQLEKQYETPITEPPNKTDGQIQSTPTASTVENVD